ncbi:MAG: mshA 3 [Candidatus Saccharibacteria bacterium]|nr:mshA 3 [Candidatus Saccharibacteria bacterium]
MRIGVDLRSLEGGAQHRGIGRYASELLYSLSEIDQVNEYVFFTSAPKAKTPDLKLHGRFKYSNAAGRGDGLRGVKYIRILYITPRPISIDKYNLDVFFHIDTSQPLQTRKTPIVSVVYDLIPYIYKDLYQHVHLGGYTPGHLIGYSRMRLKWRVMEGWLQRYKKDARIISISEHTKKDLLNYVPGINAKKVIVIPLAAGKLPQIDKNSKDAMEKLGLKQFLFYVGGADPRKGLVNLASTLEKVWEEFPDTQIVFAGKEINNTEVPEAVKLHKTIANLSKPKQVRLIGFVSDGELAWLYKNAVAFVFPSRYEGFGLPILEAMQAGCPVITYDNSSLPEVAGKGAMVLKDGLPMNKAICKLLGDSELRRKLIVNGKKQAAKFTWQYTAEQTLQVLESAAKEKS